MISFINIRTIARYERKILSRSWFFRIFSALAIVFIGIFTSAMVFEQNGFTYAMRAVSSNLPYNALFMLNIAQSIVAIFLASDFLKRDKKLALKAIDYIETEYRKTIDLYPDLRDKFEEIIEEARAIVKKESFEFDLPF